MKLVLTCEHGGNEIPNNQKPLFALSKDTLRSHRGYDPGALDLFQQLSGLANVNKAQTVSRLLIETNRSLHHPHLFSDFTKTLAPEEKKEIIEKYYESFRAPVEKAISDFIKKGEEVLHFSVHSFTPQLNGKDRTADIGLLYDPSRIKEKLFCSRFKAQLKGLLPDLRIRFNYPYLGKADGFTTHLRKKFQQQYSGIELEVNQKFSVNNQMDPKLKSAVFKALQNIIKQENPMI